jgi:hypothetical protein
MTWIHGGFDAFTKGTFDGGRDNLYVTADGVIETIHRTGFNPDGHVDLVFPNAHGYTERGPTRIYRQPDTAGAAWSCQELANDSCWMSRAIDVDGDGYLDLIVINGENGVTSELDSYVYWGGPDGLTGERTELPTGGGYDVAAVDLTGNGRTDLIIPSAWTDHHNPGKPRPTHVFEQVAPRHFEEVTEQYGLLSNAGLSLVCEDLNGNGHLDVVIANYRKGFEYDTDSFLYWGTANGFDTANPLQLPTHFALQVEAGDLNGNGFRDLVFSGGNQVCIYWNRNGVFDPQDRLIFETEGNNTMFAVGSVRTAIADINLDGRNELMIATKAGVEIRTIDDLEHVHQLLPLAQASAVAAVDLDRDGRPELIVSKYEDGKLYNTNSAIFWNGPDGFCESRTTPLPTAGAMGCTAADLDGDGKPEIIFCNTMGGPSQFDVDFPVYVYPGNEACEYSTERRLELPAYYGSNTYVMADLNHNGYVDLVFVSGDGLRVFHGGPDGLQPDRYTVLKDRGEMYHYVLVGDFNHNGWLDVLGVAYTYDAKPETMAKSSCIYWGSADGFSNEHTTVVPTACAGNGQLADLDRNGWLDFIAWDRRGYLAVYAGGPDGFSPERLSKIHIPDIANVHVAAICRADLNSNGYLDLIVTEMGHYQGGQSGFRILHGSAEGYSAERSEFHRTEASSILISICDLNNNGHLDMLVPAYSTKFSRELPAHIYWGTENGIDFDNPMAIPCDASCAFQAIDITGNGYRDLLTICHRNDIGHLVDSLLFWNGPDGISFDNVTRIPAMGPHLASPRDFGNAHTREPLERYISPAYNLAGKRPAALSWDADVPKKCSLHFDLRWAESKDALDQTAWVGPTGEGSRYETPGTIIPEVPKTAAFLEYRATFVSDNGCLTPKLREVTVTMI